MTASTGARVRTARQEIAEMRGRARRKSAVILGRMLMPPLMLAAVLCFAVFLSPRAARYAYGGMLLAAKGVLPSAFVGMLICDLYRAYGRPERMRAAGWMFSLLYGMPREGLRAVILGNLCGFPMGAREVMSCLDAGGLTEDEAERLIPLTMNPSPPFIVGAVGAAMLGDVKEGIALLLAVELSAVAVGVLFRKRRVKSRNTPVIIGQIKGEKYSFVRSVRSAAEGLVTVSGFIIAFSVLLGFLSEIAVFTPVRAVVFSLTEVTGGVKYFSGLTGISPLLRGCAVAFTLGFGGLSVMLQGAALTDGRLSMRRYLPVKLAQGVISALLYSLLRARILGV